MATISKYSNTLNTSKGEYLSNKEYMEKVRKNEIANAPDDLRTPFSYSEWLERNSWIIPGAEYEQYNNYVTNWYKNTYTKTNTIEDIKKEYLTLVEELKIFVSPEDKLWIDGLDFDDPLDVDAAIPFFVEKLKDIAIYLRNKRDAVKLAKLKYNMVGSYNALQKLFYEYLLKTFTQRDYVLNVSDHSGYSEFPELSTVADGFQIIIEELYDDTNYLDKDPNVPITSYYNLTSDEMVDYFGELDFDTDNLEWLYKTGIDELYADNPLFWTINTTLSTHGVSSVEDLPLSAYSEFDGQLLNEYIQFRKSAKYLGEDQYVLSGGYYVANTKTFDYDFDIGNNWFYWTSGEYIREYDNSVIYDSIALSDTTLISSGAVAATNYIDADKIFVEQNNSISGAWLKHSFSDIVDDDMEATLFSERNTIFKFPFPGYGISGDSLPWSGPELSNSFVMDSYDSAILDRYWNTLSLSAINPLSIHDTTLIDAGATPSQNYLSADEITTRTTSVCDKIHDTNPDSIYKGEFDRAWLYKMLKTDIPLSVGQTYVNWPITTYDSGTETMALTIPSSQCVPITLSSLDVENDIVGARAGHGLFDSDIIYKLDAPNGNAIECAFLSGTDLKTLASSGSTLLYGATGIIQPSFTLKCRPGNAERFVWQDDTIGIDQTTINHTRHQVDCKYYTQRHESILDTVGVSLATLGTNGIGDWDNCTCRAIKYSPLGHPGDNYTDYERMADIIFVDTQFPEPFDINTWVGTDGKPYNTSKDFAFFKLTGDSNVETDVGWGEGEWKTGDGSTFQLTKGVVYKYLRSNLYRSPSDLLIKAVPDLIIKQKHVNTPKTVWMTALLDTTNVWTKTYDTSPMVIRPNDYIMYDHVDSNWFCLTANDTRELIGTEQVENVNTYNSYWANYDLTVTGSVVSYNWPEYYHGDGPDLIAQELTSVSWSVLYPDAVTTYNSIDVEPSTSFNFEATQIGVYTVSVTGYSDHGVESLTITPNLTAALETDVTRYEWIGDVDIITTYNDRINMTVNTELTGWDYSTNQYNETAIGGRPFWAKVYDDDSIQTKYKGTMKWGGGIRTVIDDYTLITQPDVATVSLSTNSYVNYKRNGTSNILWSQPIEIINNNESKTWCTLEIDPNLTSPLSSYLYNIDKELVIYANDEESSIVLSNETPTFINYWANSGFTWSQELVDSTQGIPPTGGKWIPAISGSLVESSAPYANLLNRHYPTVATVPYIGGLYSIDDVGGYFLPKNIGLSTYIGKDYTNVISTEGLENTYNRGMSGVFQDPEIYTSDAGISYRTQVSPISTIDVDSSWMKSGINFGSTAGRSNNLRDYPEFIPYQTKYETDTINYNGIRAQNDEYDPWTGTMDNEWRDVQTFPPNFKNEYDIDGWYDSIDIPNKFVYQWKTDIFGNQYFLLKSKDLEGIYEKANATGYIMVKDPNGRAIAGSDKLSSIYSNLSLFGATISADLSSNNIKDIDIWFDTIMIETPNHLLMEKILFDYETNTITSIADDANIIDLESLSGGNFAGIWLFDEERLVTICTLLSSNATNSIYPVLYSLNLNTNNLSTIFNGIDNTECIQTSALSLSSIESPTFSYDYNTRTYNTSFIGYANGNGDGMILTTIDIIPELDTPINISSITPLS
jgi:hypothetical protein